VPLRSEEDDLAEVAAVSMAVVKAIGALASPPADKGRYLARILERGLRDLETVDCRHIPSGRRAAFREKVKARYTDLITAIPAK
jgi:hypothetical protein